MNVFRVWAVILAMALWLIAVFPAAGQAETQYVDVTVDAQYLDPDLGVLHAWDGATVYAVDVDNNVIDSCNTVYIMDELAQCTLTLPAGGDYIVYVDESSALEGLTVDPTSVTWRVEVPADIAGYQQPGIVFRATAGSRYDQPTAPQAQFVDIIVNAQFYGPDSGKYYAWNGAAVNAVDLDNNVIGTCFTEQVTEELAQCVLALPVGDDYIVYVDEESALEGLTVDPTTVNWSVEIPADATGYQQPDILFLATAGSRYDQPAVDPTAVPTSAPVASTSTSTTSAPTVKSLPTTGSGAVDAGTPDSVYLVVTIVGLVGASAIVARKMRIS